MSSSIERQLLRQLAQFLQKNPFVVGDEDSIRDMVQRYANPPMTLHYRVMMRMTVQDFNALNALLEKVEACLQPPPESGDGASTGSAGDPPLEQTADDH